MHPDHTLTADEEIDLLDLLVILAENIKLLILGPLLAGLVAFGSVSLWPVTYHHESSFILQGLKKVGSVEIFTPAQVNQLVTSPAVLDDAAKTLQDSGQGDWVTLLKSGAVTAQVLSKTTQVMVRVKAQDPQAAQAVAEALLKSSLVISHVASEVKANIQAELQKDQQSLEQARLMETRLSQNLNHKNGLPNLNLLLAYQRLVDSISHIAARIETNKNRLVGLEDNDIITRPTVSTTTTSPKLKAIPAISFLATGFALLLFVFVRQAFRNASANPVSAVKIARIRHALGLKALT